MQVLTTLLFIALIAATFAQSPISVISRSYYVGGSFSNVRQYNATLQTHYNVPAGNIASFDGKAGLWSAIAGVGTNGVVETVKVDTCLNIYIGGSFSTVSGVTTGPAAKYNIKTKTWSPIHATGVTAPTYQVNPTPTVYSITVDCANAPSSTDCPCDVYIGGRFRATFTDAQNTAQTAVNVLKYDYNTKFYEPLGGPNHGLDRFRNGNTGAVVNTIYKKGFGIFTEPLKFLWVGGDFNNSFNRWDKSTKSWSFYKPTTPTGFDSNAVIYDMYYKVGAFLDTDTIFLAGKYTYTPATGTACSNICEFNYKDETFTAVSNNQPSSQVNAVDYVTISDRLVIGTQTESENLSRVRYVNKPSPSVAFADYGVSTVIKNAITRPVRSLSTCGTALCYVGSWAVVAYNSKSSFGGDEILQFYSEQLKQVQPFGGATTGQARVIVPIVASANSVIISFASIIFMVIFALVY